MSDYNTKVESGDYTTKIDNDNITIDVNNQTIELSLARSGAQGAKGDPGDSARLELYSDTETYEQADAVVSSLADPEIYFSLHDNNFNNPLSDTDWWRPIEANVDLDASDFIAGYGILISDSDSKVKIEVNDSEIASEISWVDLRSDSDYMAETFEVAADTGLEIVMDSDGKVRLQKYTAPAGLAITFASIPNKSWFGTDDSLTRTVSATSGTLDSITASGSGNPTVNGLNISFTASATPGSYSLRADGTGEDAGGNADTASHSDSYTTYRDWFLHTGQSSGTETGQLSGGREQSNLSNGHSFTIPAGSGHTYIAYSASLTVAFKTNLGDLIPNYTYTQNYTVSGVTHSYTVAYLGQYVNSSTVTVEVS